MIIKGKNIHLYKIPSRALRYSIGLLVEEYKDITSTYYLKRIRKKKHEKDRLIRVAFIVQMPEIWDKEESVFDAMEKNSEFEVKLIVVPPYDQVNRRVRQEYDDNYFLKHYPSSSFKAYNNEKWILDGLEYDYVFYQRPYDHYLPEILQSCNVVKVSKCCYIPYGFCGADVFNDGNTNRAFFRNMSHIFAESDYMAKVLANSFRNRRDGKFHKIHSLGYPALQPYFLFTPLKEYKRILWTPRWSYAPKIGGSHFLEYKETIFNLKSINNDIEITFRPHPLLFGELINKSLLEENEITEYLNNLEENKIEYDHGKPILETFKATDILITDFSSIIIQFFVTGRPIVYCESDIEFNETYKCLAEGMYIVHSEEEMIDVVKQLINGKDPLFNKRKKIIKELFSFHYSATSNVLECIINDFRITGQGRITK